MEIVVTKEFLAFKRAYHAWIYAVSFSDREECWKVYCMARDRFFGSGAEVYNGIIPAVGR